MKLIFLFFLFFITLTSIGLIQAVGFSPTSLIFELEPNQKECKMVTINSDSEKIVLSDSWADNKDIEWKISLFDADGSVHGISLDYPSELSLDERELEVCLSGSDLGEYHGALLMTEEQQGNSIIQFGVWLKVIISEGGNDDVGESSGGGSSSSGGSSGSSGSSSGGGSGGSGSSSGEANLVIEDSFVKESEEVFELITTTNEEKIDSEDYSSGITGGVVGANESNRNLFIPGLIIFVVAVLIIYNIYNKKSYNKKSYNIMENIE